jgi:hypothetical protein
MSDNVKDRLEKLNAVLAEYERKSGLPNKPIEHESEQYISITKAELKAMSADECGEAAVLLAQLSLYLQRIINEEHSRFSWAEESIKKIIAPMLSNYKAYSFEERKLCAINDNIEAQTLDKVRVNAKIRIDRMSYLATRIEFLSKTFLDLQRSKNIKRSL